MRGDILTLSAHVAFHVAPAAEQQPLVLKSGNFYHPPACSAKITACLFSSDKPPFCLDEYARYLHRLSPAYKIGGAKFLDAFLRPRNIIVKRVKREPVLTLRENESLPFFVAKRLFETLKLNTSTIEDLCRGGQDTTPGVHEFLQCVQLLLHL
ncbi:hypothetical protein [Rhizobium metallidurans]|uniref:Uncharacterized protein n=1 Tax=Rhizobium metallidurans TaxID=1265931 RepID=A0A7W6CQ29_9HYPH|nr:hypothetical protein [Rhizobium metallidurans]MBB3965117.1 hypothetical protein [Rhizobium metallidurans]